MREPPTSVSPNSFGPCQPFFVRCLESHGITAPPAPTGVCRVFSCASVLAVIDTWFGSREPASSQLQAKTLRQRVCFALLLETSCRHLQETHWPTHTVAALSVLGWTRWGQQAVLPAEAAVEAALHEATLAHGLHLFWPASLPCPYYVVCCTVSSWCACACACAVWGHGRACKGSQAGIGTVRGMQ